jgi:hypothetical protein
VERTFAGLPTFWPMVFHLLFSYSLMALSKAALCFQQQTVSIESAATWFSLHASSCAYLIFRKFCVVHILQMPLVGASKCALKNDGAQQTLYQCFLTLPSVLVGKVCRRCQRRPHTAVSIAAEYAD